MTDQSCNLLRIQLLGGFQIFAGERVIPPEQFRLRKARTLIKVLALALHHRLHRDQLIEMLWPDAEDVDTAINSLNQAIYAARRGLMSAGLPGQEILQFNEEVLCLCPQFPLWIDAVDFEQAAAAARRNHNLALAACQTALSLYPGDLLPEDRYEDWAEERRESLRQERLRLLHELARLEEEQLDYPGAINHLQQALEVDPACEEAHASLMRAWALNGQRSAALAQFEACREALEKELGVEPSPATLTLYQKIRDGRLGPPPTLSSTPSTHPATLPTWLIPFIGRARQLSQVREYLSDPSYRLISLVGPGGCGKTRLAVEAVSTQQEYFPDGIFFIPLVGVFSSSGIIPAVIQALGVTPNQTDRNPRQFLLDIIREKSILLLLDNFEHLLEGAVLISEILIACPRVKILVTSRASLNLLGEVHLPVAGMTIPHEQPMSRQAALEYSGVRLFIEGARRMIPGYEPDHAEMESVLDICRLVEGIPLAILLAAGWMRLLTPGEIASQVRQHSLDFLESTSPDLPERQRSLRAVFDYSWQLLEERERHLIACISVFKGGFTAEAVQQVCGAALVDLAALMDHSFLNRSANRRYELHELLRQYAQEKLEKKPDRSHETHERHTRYYIDLLSQFNQAVSPAGVPDHEKIPDLLTSFFSKGGEVRSSSDHSGDEAMKAGSQVVELAEMDREIGNIQAAWGWAAAHKQVERLITCRGGLGQYYMGRFRFAEGKQAFAEACQALQIRDETSQPEMDIFKAELLAWQSRFCESLFQGEEGQKLMRQALGLVSRAGQAGVDVRSIQAYYQFLLTQTYAGASSLPDSQALLTSSLALYRALGDRRGEARVLLALGYLHLEWGNYPEAEPLYQQSLEIYRSLGADYEYHHTRLYLGEVQTLMGHFEGAEDAWADAIAYFRKSGKVRGLARGLYTLGQLRLKSGQFTEMIAPLEECLFLCQEMHNRHDYARTQMFLGYGYSNLGRYSLARQCLSEALVYFSESASKWRSGITKFFLSEVCLAEDSPLDARMLLTDGLADMRTVIQYGMYIEAFPTLALVELRLGDVDKARQTLAETLHLSADRNHRDSHACTLRSAIAYFAAIGEVERAVELYALATRIPFLINSLLCRDLVWASIEQQALSLPPETAVAARAGGLQRELWPTIRELAADPHFTDS